MESSELRVHIEPKFSFGLENTVMPNVEFIRNDTLLYPVGNHFAVHNIAEKSLSSVGGDYLQQNVGFLSRELNQQSDINYHGSTKLSFKEGIAQAGKNQPKDKLASSDPGLYCTAYTVNPVKSFMAVAEHSHEFHSTNISIINVAAAAKGSRKQLMLSQHKTKTLSLPSFNPATDLSIPVSLEDDAAAAASTSPTVSPPTSRFAPYDLHQFIGEKRVLKPQAAPFTRVILMCFSEDGRYLALQGDLPRWPLMIWQWQTQFRLQKQLLLVNEPVHSIAFSPFSNHEVTVCGPNVWKTWHVEQEHVTQQTTLNYNAQVQRLKNESYAGFCYLRTHTDALACVTESNIFVVMHGVVTQTISIADLCTTITSISCTKRGFAVGCTGKLLLFEFVSPKLNKYASSGSNPDEKGLRNGRIKKSNASSQAQIVPVLPKLDTRGEGDADSDDELVTDANPSRQRKKYDQDSKHMADDGSAVSNFVKSLYARQFTAQSCAASSCTPSLASSSSTSSTSSASSSSSALVQENNFAAEHQAGVLVDKYGVLTNTDPEALAQLDLQDRPHGFQRDSLTKEAKVRHDCAFRAKIVPLIRQYHGPSSGAAAGHALQELCKLSTADEGEIGIVTLAHKLNAQAQDGNNLTTGPNVSNSHPSLALPFLGDNKDGNNDVSSDDDVDEEQEVDGRNEGKVFRDDDASFARNQEAAAEALLPYCSPSSSSSSSSSSFSSSSIHSNPPFPASVIATAHAGKTPSFVLFDVKHMAISMSLQVLVLSSASREIMTISLAELDLVDNTTLAQASKAVAAYFSPNSPSLYSGLSISSSSSTSVSTSAVSSSALAPSPAATLYCHLNPSYLTHVMGGLHEGGFSGFDTALEQPLLVTCSTQDHSLRVYNYQTQVVQLITVFPASQRLQAVAFHPSGLQIAASFQRFVNIYALLNDRLQHRAAILCKKVSMLRYSPGGSFLALVSGQEIFIHAANTLKRVATFSKHLGPIMDLSWTGDENILTSVCTGGGLYTWSISMRKRIHDFNSKTVRYMGVAADALNNVAVCGIEMGVRETRFGQEEPFEKLLVLEFYSVKDAVLENYNVISANKNKLTGSPSGYIDKEDSAARDSTSHTGAQTAAMSGTAKQEATKSLLMQHVIKMNFPGEVLDHSATTAAAGATVGEDDKEQVASSKRNQPSVAELELRQANEARRLKQQEREQTTKVTYALGAQQYENYPAGKANRVRGKGSNSGVLSQALRRLLLPSSLASFPPGGGVRGSENIGSKYSNTESAHSLHASGPKSPLEQAELDKQAVLYSSAGLRDYRQPTPFAAGESGTGGGGEGGGGGGGLGRKYWHMGLIGVGSAQCLVIGTHLGSLLLFRWPLQPGTACVEEIQLHNGPILSLRCCSRTGCIITCSVDGNIFVSSPTLIYKTLTNQGNDYHSLQAFDPDEEAGIEDMALLSYLGRPFSPPLYPLMPAQQLQDIRGKMGVEEFDEQAKAHVIRWHGRGRLYNVDFGLTLMPIAQLEMLQLSVVQLHIQCAEMRARWQYKQDRDTHKVSQLLKEQKSTYLTRFQNLHSDQRLLQEKDMRREQEVIFMINKMEQDRLQAIEAMELVYEKKLSIEAKKLKDSEIARYDAEVQSSLDMERLRLQFVQDLAAAKAAFEVQVEQKANEAAQLKHQLASNKEQYVNEFVAEAEEYYEAVEALEVQTDQRVGAADLEVKKQKNTNSILRGQLFLQSQRIQEKVSEINELNMQLKLQTVTVQTLTGKMEACSSRLETTEKQLSEQTDQADTLHAANVQLIESNQLLSHQITDLIRLTQRNNTEEASQYFENTVCQLDDEFEEKRMTIVSQERALIEKTKRLTVEKSKANKLAAALQDKEIELSAIKDDIFTIQSIQQLRDKHCPPASHSQMMQAALQNSRVSDEFEKQVVAHKKNMLTMQHQLQSMGRDKALHDAQKTAQNAELMQQNEVLRRELKKIDNMVRYLSANAIRVTANHRAEIEKLTQTQMMSPSDRIREFLQRHCPPPPEFGEAFVAYNLDDPDLARRGLAAKKEGAVALGKQSEVDIMTLAIKKGQTVHGMELGEKEQARLITREREVNTKRKIIRNKRGDYGFLHVVPSGDADIPSSSSSSAPAPSSSSSSSSSHHPPSAVKSASYFAGPHAANRVAGEGALFTTDPKLSKEAEHLFLQSFQTIQLQDMQIKALQDHLNAVAEARGFFEFDPIVAAHQVANHVKDGTDAYAPRTPLVISSSSSSSSSSLSAMNPPKSNRQMIRNRMVAREKAAGAPASPAVPPPDIPFSAAMLSTSKNSYTSGNFIKMAVQGKTVKQTKLLGQSSALHRSLNHNQQPLQRPQSSMGGSFIGGDGLGASRGAQLKERLRPDSASAVHGNRY